MNESEEAKIMKKTAVAFAVLVALLAVAAEGAPPQKTATPTPRPSVRKDLAIALTPAPSIRTDLTLNLPPCSVVGTLKSDGGLLAFHNATVLQGFDGAKSAYKGTMTITADRPMLAFRATRVEVSRVDGVGGVQFVCGGWPTDISDVAKGQTKTYPVQCFWGATATAPLEGQVKVGWYKLLPDGTKAGSEAYCEGRLPLIQ